MNVREIYRAERLPVFQNRMFRSKEDATDCAKGDVVLVQDLDTGLVSNQAFEPDLVQYDADYQNEQALSPVFREHLRDVSQVIRRHFAGASLIEVGCGKGYFLQQLRHMGFRATGLDPAYEGSDPSIIKDYFTAETGIQAEGIILRHVLEHIQDPVAFLSELRDANGGHGKVYIEVPCFDWIRRNRAWFDIYYEHVNYFRLPDLYRMFASVYEAGHMFGGQYLYAVADLATIRTPVYDASARAQLPEGFLDVDRYVGQAMAQGARSDTVALWGGASKGVIFALFMERAGAKIDVVIDINPAKQGRYLPATGLRVHSPEEATSLLAPGAKVFVMNSNYLGEVRELTGNRFSYLLVGQENYYGES